MKRQSGLTLVELMVAVGLTWIVVGGAYFLFLSGSRQTVKLDRELRRIQSLQLLLEHLSSDVAQAVKIPAEAEGRNLAGERELLLYRFLRYRADPRADELDPDAAHSVLTEEVRYRFDPVDGILTRNGEALPVELLEEIRFYPPATSSPGLGIYVRTAPDRHLGASSRVGSRDMTFLIPHHMHSLRETHSEWQENYFDLVPGVVGVSEADTSR